MSVPPAKATFYASDGKFHINQLDGHKWVPGSNPEDLMKWEKISFDVWNEQFLGWLDILISGNGDCIWHFYERDPSNPNKGVLLHFEPMRVDVTDRKNIFATVCEKIFLCHKYTLEQDDSEQDWKKTFPLITERVGETEVVRA